MKQQKNSDKKNAIRYGVLIIAVFAAIILWIVGQKTDNTTSEHTTSEHTTSEQTTEVSSDGMASSDTDESQTTMPEGTVIYQNDTYAFKVALPAWWAGYQVIEEEWHADVFDESGTKIEGETETGPKITIRNPAYTNEVPTEDMPILILTHAQWLAMQEDGENGAVTLHIGAAPVGPSFLAENDAYVFALPARYNYDFAKGYEEVDELLQNGAVEAIEQQ